MAAKIKILVEGYTNADQIGILGQEQDCATVTLVKDGDLVMVVDPGVMKNPQILTDALRREGIKAEEVNAVCVTHSHIDHYRNVGLFPNAEVLEHSGIWRGDAVYDWHTQFSPNVQVLNTPGHSQHAITLLVTTRKGVVAICGDVFWKENSPEDPNEDPYASNPEKLKESREVVLKSADWIIPGHAGMYKNDRVGAAASREEITQGTLRAPEAPLICRKCGREMRESEKCRCRPWLCFKCCECDITCELCSCAYKKGVV